ncbi:GtrA family protein [Nocardioides humi]|uniref:GtrA family protein n=1 Tax=Nocardioides humi TaxID=449461 RepID=UPI0015E86AD9|nr:glycosyltransferase family 2 protein [Nocardioides humi]
MLIPAYQPSAELIGVVTGLLRARPAVEVLVVDDGSGPSYAPVFSAARTAGAHVLHLDANHGKGFALRAGIRHLDDVRAAGPVVTADADGQHAVADILRVLDAVDTRVDAPPHLVLGVRALDEGVPLRSRIGNTATRLLFRAASGRRLHDTQTGLRAFPATLLPWLLTLRGDRYEYELVMLLHAARHGVVLRTVPIATIYLDGNESSHFRPVADSVRIYAPLLLFVASSLSAFAIDTVALLVLHSLLGSLLVAVVGARLLSASVNFAVNRRLVFGGAATPWHRAARRYAALAVLLLAANYLVLAGLYGLGLPLLAAKLVTEVLLVATSYVVQARFVFARRHDRSGRSPGVHA